MRDAIEGKENGTTDAKATQIWNYIWNRTSFSTTAFLQNLGCPSIVDNDKLNDDIKLNFLGYSGGGPIAYTTSQRLVGRLFVDNLIMFGSPWKAYNGTNNIGHIWEVWAERDLNFPLLDYNHNYGGLANFFLGSREYNEGWEYQPPNPYAPCVNGQCENWHRVYNSAHDIYKNINVRRDVFGDINSDHNSYFKFLRRTLLDYLINTVGIE
jgi:hypothetical protein